MNDVPHFVAKMTGYILVCNFTDLVTEFKIQNKIDAVLHRGGAPFCTPVLRRRATQFSPAALHHRAAFVNSRVASWAPVLQCRAVLH